MRRAKNRHTDALLAWGRRIAATALATTGERRPLPFATAQAIVEAAGPPPGDDRT